MEKRIATLTFQGYDNYGAILQSYALQKSIEALGHASEVIRYDCAYIRHPASLRRLKTKGLFNYVYGIVGKICYLPRRRKCSEFRKRLRYGPAVTRKTVAGLDGAYDVWIAGSDQIWDWHLTDFDTTYFLDFVTKGKRCSYAVSIGEHVPPDEYLAKYRELLSRFDTITMRERYGADIAESLTGKRPEQVCDPTLLLTAEQWGEILVPSGRKAPYILVYQLGISPELVRFVARLKKKTGMKVVYVPFPLVGILPCDMKLSVGPAEWMGLFRDAACVVTDSFHGVVFSVLFERAFYALVDGHHMNRRAQEFLSQLGLSDRAIVPDADADPSRAIDYGPVRARVEEMRARSLNALKHMIED